VISGSPRPAWRAAAASGLRSTARSASRARLAAQYRPALRLPSGWLATQPASWSSRLLVAGLGAGRWCCRWGSRRVVTAAQSRVPWPPDLAMSWYGLPLTWEGGARMSPSSGAARGPAAAGGDRALGQDPGAEPGQGGGGGQGQAEQPQEQAAEDGQRGGRVGGQRGAELDVAGEGLGADDAVSGCRWPGRRRPGAGPRWPGSASRVRRRRRS
jgi:hypothetical protein